MLASSNIRLHEKAAMETFSFFVEKLALFALHRYLKSKQKTKTTVACAVRLAILKRTSHKVSYQLWTHVTAENIVDAKIRQKIW